MEGAGRHDIRFFMGTNFRKQNVTVDEMLNLIRTQYLVHSQKGDPAGGLAHLVRTINQRMGAGQFAGNSVAAIPPENQKGAMQKLISHLQSRKVEALADLTAPEGLIILPYGGGIPGDGLKRPAVVQILTAMTQGVTPPGRGLQYYLPRPT